MTGLQRACALGAALWLLTHAPMVAVLGLGDSRAPLLSLLAVVAVCGVSAALLRPLAGAPLALSARAAWAAALVLPLSGLAVMPFLEAASWRTYANWWPGAGQVVVAALVVRRRPLAGVAAELGGAAVIVGCVLADGAARGTSPDLVTILALNQPATLWLPAALGIRAVFDRTSREVARYEADAGTSVAAGAAAEARAASARTRRADLEVTAVPLLERVAASASPETAPTTTTPTRTTPTTTTAVGTPVATPVGARRAATGWDELARRARVLERQLRDDLGARAVLDAPLRAAVRGARARGSVVEVVDDRRHPAETGLVADVRPALAAALDACRGASVTARLGPEGDVVTLAVDGSVTEVREVAAALERAAGVGVGVAVDLEPGSLWAELSRPAAATPR
ncbi:hypothetical protein GTR02_19910 [Kineococcus sp. R8]|uniref:hypothetical protein n=1 Tax=Kineococcus siccus TaxID=2696567 RepID=UPI001411F2B8|nr:hypothetical protein [Kineococcus siccus]NAZ84076.1 hypothetical protein [Kineococcus siccus]